MSELNKREITWNMKWFISELVFSEYTQDKFKVQLNVLQYIFMTMQ